STGPYQISRYVPGKEVVFSRNPYFHEWSAAAQPALSPDQIVWTFGEPVPRELADVESGRADWNADSVPDAASLAAQYPTRVHVNPAFSIDYVAFNTRVPLFNDKRVRQAFSLAADRSKLATMLGGPDVAVPTCQLLPPGISGYAPYCPFTVDPSPSGAWLGPDLPAARKLVAQSGTEGMRIVFWNVPGNGPTTTFAVSVLRSLGYRVSVVSPSLPVYFENVNDSRKRVQVSAASMYLDYPTASDMFDQLFRCSSWKLADPGATHDGSFYCDPRLDDLMNEADRVEGTNPSGAASIWAAVDRGVTDDAPWVALATLTQVDFVSSRVSNYQYNPAIGVLLDQLVVHQ
ncbi:MAG TPA: ABC transporter substrate-binding protein, partial [Acidimicrobiales bacterium]|nr:ABC transporter substrate-binding protein [Acidimicrobiales bacterium]